MTRAISAPTIDKTAILTNDDVEIFVGDAAQIAEKDQIARGILAREKGKVVYINVRVVERPTWRGLE
jgi:cell division protein FtsQ